MIDPGMMRSGPFAALPASKMFNLFSSTESAYYLRVVRVEYLVGCSPEGEVKVRTLGHVRRGLETWPFTLGSKVLKALAVHSAVVRVRESCWSWRRHEAQDLGALSSFSVCLPASVSPGLSAGFSVNREYSMSHL